MTNEQLAALKASLTVGTITSVTIKFGETIAGQSAVLLPDSNVTASWTIEGDVESCSYQVTDPDGTVIASQSAVTQNSLAISSLQITAGTTYTLTINVMPTNGTDADFYQQSAQFLVMGDFKMEAGIVTGYTGAGGEIVIPDVDYEGNDIIAIGEKAFLNNASITSVRIPAAVTSIRTSAFENCENLESVEAPNGVETIGAKAFKNCQKLKKMLPYNTEESGAN